MQRGYVMQRPALYSCMKTVHLRLLLFVAQRPPGLNRVGIRLRPVQPVDVKLPAELPSCGMQFGTLQWHPDGSVVAMGPEAPVTGGYLQPATVISSELWKLGQLAPGERVQLVAD